MLTARLSGLVASLALLAVSCGGSTPPSGVALGREVYADSCSSCHGASGQGGVGPSLATVIATWPECSDHLRWISLGSAGWRDAVGETYGATAKPVQGGMPGHQGVLTAEQIAAVAAFERITYGGADEAETLAACGVASG